MGFFVSTLWNLFCLLTVVRDVEDKNAPFKQKVTFGNSGPFMNSEFSKIIANQLVQIQLKMAFRRSNRLV